MISAEKQSALEVRMEQLGIYEDDLAEKFVLGSGHGGQKVNKTASCVFLLHEPSGLHVKCQEGRSRAANRHTARELLCDRIEEEQLAEQQRKTQAREKRRRRNRRPSARAKARNVEAKRRRSTVKSLRKDPSSDEG